MKKIFIILLIILSLFLFVSIVLSAIETLYVCPSGSGAGATDGSDWDNCFDGFSDVVWNASDETAGAVDPGDTLLLRDDDGPYYETLTIGASGASGNPITIGADTDESPVISGISTIADSFALVSSEEYKTSFTPAVDPKVVYEDGTWMKCETVDLWNNDRGTVWNSAGSNVYWQGGIGTAPVAVFDNSGSTWNKLIQVFSEAGMSSGEYYHDNSLGKLYIRATGDENLQTAANNFVHVVYTYKGTLNRNECYYDLPTSELYMRASDGQDPDTHTLTYSARAYGINASNKSYITISGLAIEKPNSTPIRAYYTSSGGNLTVTDNTLTYYGEYGYLLDGSTSFSGTISNFTFQGNTVQYGPMRFWDLDINANQHIYAGIQLGTLGMINNVDTFNIKYNLIDGNSTGVHGSGSSADREGIFSGMDIAGNMTIEGNEITRIDHGIYIFSIGCPTTKVRYNYIHDISDDGVWLQSCSNSDPSDVLIYANKIIDVGDDGIQINSTKATILNNTIIDPISTGMSITAAGSVIKNNLVQAVSGACSATGDAVCIMQLKNINATDVTMDNNLYYSPLGTSGENFWSNDGAGPYTFSEWQGINSGKEMSSFFSNPNLNSSGVSNNIVDRQGVNVCNNILDILKDTATWSAGVAPALAGACPEADPLFDVGAFNYIGEGLR